MRRLNILMKRKVNFLSAVFLEVNVQNTLTMLHLHVNSAKIANKFITQVLNWVGSLYFHLSYLLIATLFKVYLVL